MSWLVTFAVITITTAFLAFVVLASALPRRQLAGRVALVLGLAVLIPIVLRRFTSVYLFAWFGTSHLYMDPLGVGGSLGLILYGIYAMWFGAKEVKRNSAPFTVESDTPEHTIHLERRP